MTFADLLAAPQYSLTQDRKEAELTPQFNRLTEHHREKCAPMGSCSPCCMRAR